MSFALTASFRNVLVYYKLLSPSRSTLNRALALVFCILVELRLGPVRYDTTKRDECFQQHAVWCSG